MNKVLQLTTGALPRVIALIAITCAFYSQGLAQTAGGTTFLNLEDESGLINVVCSKGLWDRYKSTARGAPALIVRGILERTETPRMAKVAGDGTREPTPIDGPPGVVLNLIADRIELLTLDVRPGPSRDFR